VDILEIHAVDDLDATRVGVLVEVVISCSGAGPYLERLSVLIDIVCDI
jgi:hypothetical protein